MSRSRITRYSSISITPEQARDARAHAWAYIFDCHAKKKAARPGGPDDGTKFKEDSANVPIIQK